MVHSPLKDLRFNLGPGGTRASFPIVIICSININLTTPGRAQLYRAPSTFIGIHSLYTSSWENTSALLCSANANSSYLSLRFTSQRSPIDVSNARPKETNSNTKEV
jgi:hypothetical protein